MRRQSTSATEDVLDNQILVLLQHHRRLTFLTLADALPMYTWQSLFAALSSSPGEMCNWPAQNHYDVNRTCRHGPTNIQAWYYSIDANERLRADRAGYVHVVLLLVLGIAA